MKKFFVALYVALFTSSVHAAVWTTKQTWNADWEKKFETWVAGPEWNKDFFVQAGPFQGMKLDCADAVYSMRFLFAAKNGLPFVIKDPTGGRKTISNEMTRWDSLPPNQRMRAFLSYIFEVSSTSSLPNDTYPVAINREAMGSGALILTDAKSRHTWSIKYLSETGVPFLLSRSRPPTTPLFEHYEYPPAEYIFSGGMSPERNSGIRRFREPADIGKPSWQVAGYSVEQYKIPVDQWANYLQSKLALRQETTEERMSRILQSVCKVGRDRAVVVGLGNKFLSTLNQQCMNDHQYDDYSTPSRDKRGKLSFEIFEQEAQAAHGKISASLQAAVDNVLSGEQSVQSNNPFCVVDVGDGLQLTLGQVYERLMSGKMSISPHDTLRMRWGFDPFPSARAKACGR